jgi:hypothetical protein
MFIDTLILTALLVALYWVTENFLITRVVLWFAEQDVWWSPVRMEPGAGHIIMMTKGARPGGNFAMLMHGHIPGWYFHNGDRRFYQTTDPLFSAKFPTGEPVRVGFFAGVGVVWVGFFRRYYRRARRWDTWDLKPGSNQYGVVRKETVKDEDDHIFFFSTTVAIDLETIPTKEGYPAQMKVIENILLISPEKAEFLAGKWETQAIAATRTRSREYIARKTVRELRDERDSDNSTDFVDYILFANEGDPSAPRAKTIRLLPDYGVMIQGPYYADFDLESGDKEMTDAIKRQMIAREDVVTAEIRIEEARNKGKAEAELRTAAAVGIQAENKARMSVPEGADLALSEAIRVAGVKYLAVDRPGKQSPLVALVDE